MDNKFQLKLFLNENTVNSIEYKNNNISTIIIKFYIKLKVMRSKTRICSTPWHKLDSVNNINVFLWMETLQYAEWQNFIEYVKTEEFLSIKSGGYIKLD